MSYSVAACGTCGAVKQNKCEHERERTGCTYELVSGRTEYVYVGHTTRPEIRPLEHKSNPTAASILVARFKDHRFVVTQTFRLTMTKKAFREFLEKEEQKKIEERGGLALNLRSASWTERKQSDEEKAFWEKVAEDTPAATKAYKNGERVRRWKLAHPTKWRAIRKKYEKSESYHGYHRDAQAAYRERQKHGDIE